MTPLGSGEIDHAFITNITASVTNGEHVAANAIDTVTTNGITTNNMTTYWQSTSAQAESSAELLIELDKTRYFDRIVVETGPEHTGDYLRGAVVWMSNNWTDWFSADTLTVDESKADEGIITVLTGEQSAKYIAIRPGRASEDGQYWTVANISLCMTDEYTVRNHLIRRFGEARTNQMIATFQNNYIRTAKAKGVHRWKIIFKHALRNSLVPVITYAGPQIAYIITGSMVVETIFTVGGIGSKFVSAITNRDYTLIMGTTIFLATLMVFATLICDLLYKVVDPRIKYE